MRKKLINNSMLNLKKSNGFSLLELLAVIVIISLVFGFSGYFVMNYIHDSNKESNKLTLSNIKKMASVYVLDYSNDVIWMPEEKDTETSKSTYYTCVSVTTLKNKGYFKNTDTFSYEYIVVSRDSNNNIVKEDVDTTLKCSTYQSPKVSIPTSSEYCNNLIYDPSNTSDNPVVLTKELGDDAKFSFSNNTGMNAGSYVVNVNLAGGYIWEDDTTESKKITCTIKKAIPTLTLQPNGTEGTVIGTLSTRLKSDVSGMISIKSSNKEMAISNLEDKEIIANTQKEIPIELFSTRNTNTYITITVSPDDKINYYSTSVVYTIGNVTKKKVNKPDASFCTNPNYNGGFQKITTNMTGEEGYQLYNNLQKEIGEYEVTAKLKYGTSWIDGGKEDVTFVCSIKRPTIIVTYNTNGGNSCNPNTKKVVYGEKYGDLCIPIKNGYTFVGWYTNNNYTTEITKDTGVTKNVDHTLYAKWDANVYSVTLDNRSADSTGTTNYYYQYNTTKVIDGVTSYYYKDSSLNTPLKNGYTINVPTRTGYTFLGYYTEINGNGTQYIDANGNAINNLYKTAENRTLYVNWQINSYYFDLNWELDGNNYQPLNNGIITAGIKIDGVDKGYVHDYYNKHSYGTTWEIYGIKLNGTSISYHNSGKIGAKNTAISIPINTLTFSVNSSAYGTISSSLLYVLKDTTYNTSGNVLTLSDKRQITANVTNAAGFSTTFSSWSSNNGTISSKSEIKATFNRIKTDNIPPTCGSQSPSVSSWTNKDRTIEISCSDTGGAGCKQATYSKTFTTDTNTSSITIEDNAGNKTNCPITVKVDKTAPEVYLKKATAKKDAGYEILSTTKYNVHYKDTGGSQLKGLYAKAYVKSSSKKVQCNTDWVKYEGKAICTQTNSNSKYWWRAYRAVDNAGNVSNIVCIYEVTGGSIKDATGDVTKCVIGNHTFTAS